MNCKRCDLEITTKSALARRGLCSGCAMPARAMPTGHLVGMLVACIQDAKEAFDAGVEDVANTERLFELEAELDRRIPIPQSAQDAAPSPTVVRDRR